MKREWTFQLDWISGHYRVVRVTKVPKVIDGTRGYAQTTAASRSRAKSAAYVRNKPLPFFKTKNNPAAVKEPTSSDFNSTGLGGTSSSNNSDISGVMEVSRQVGGQVVSELEINISALDDDLNELEDVINEVILKQILLVLFIKKCISNRQISVSTSHLSVFLNRHLSIVQMMDLLLLQLARVRLALLDQIRPNVSKFPSFAFD